MTPPTPILIPPQWRAVMQAARDANDRKYRYVSKFDDNRTAHHMAMRLMCHPDCRGFAFGVKGKEVHVAWIRGKQ